MNNIYTASYNNNVAVPDVISKGRAYAMPLIFIRTVQPQDCISAALWSDNMIIQSYENSPRADACIKYLRGVEDVRRYENIVLLPIPTTRDGKTILNTKIDIDGLIDGFDANTLVSGYGVPSGFLEKSRKKGAVVIDLSCDEDFLLENAELTALAALGIYLTSTKRSVRDTSVGIVGYGRIGKKLTNLFLYLGASVRVFTSREGTRLDLCEWGVTTEKSSKDADLLGLDLLINTAPASIFDKEIIPAGLRIIDLASGDNFQGVPSVEKYPSIPAKMFPESAGRVWGRAIERYLTNNL